MRSRNGFTLLEVLVVLILVGVVGGMAMVNVARSMERSNIHRAAAVIATDLREAFSLAARQRRPVDIVVDAGARRVRVRDVATPTTIYAERLFNVDSEQPVQTMVASAPEVRIYPNGMAADTLRITVGWGDRTRFVRMTRAGMVRVGGT